MRIKRLTKVSAQWLGTVDQGMRLEIVAMDSKGLPLENISYPLATILADEESEELLFEIYTNEGIVQFPLSDLKRAIDASEGEVHSEAWYEKNVYGGEKST